MLDAGFGDDGQPLTRATRAKLVVKAAKSAQRRVVRLMDGDAATFNGLAEEALACLQGRRAVRGRPRRLGRLGRAGLRRRAADRRQDAAPST